MRRLTGGAAKSPGEGGAGGKEPDDEREVGEGPERTP